MRKTSRWPSPLGCVAPFCHFHMLDTTGFGEATLSPSKSLCTYALRFNAVKVRYRERGGNGLQLGLASPGARLMSLTASPLTNSGSGSPLEKEATGFRKPLCQVPFVALLWQPEMPGFSDFPTSYNLSPCVRAPGELGSDYSLML